MDRREEPVNEMTDEELMAIAAGGSLIIWRQLHPNTSS
jgi:hypothetical protein